MVKLCCQFCKKSFSVYEYRAKKAKFCSYSCRSKARARNPEVLFWKRVLKTTKCWIWTGNINDYGYGRLLLGGQTQIRAHRFSWELHFGPVPKGKYVLHKCDNPPCVRPDHLFLGDHLDNIKDCFSKHRHAYGSRHGRSKLTEEDIPIIEKDPRSHRKIAIDYGVSHSTIRAVKTGKRWVHVK